VSGECDAVAEHVFYWWLRQCPRVLSDSRIRALQERCDLFVSKSLVQAFKVVDNASLSRLFQSEENRQRILNVKIIGRLIFTAVEQVHLSDIRIVQSAGHRIESTYQFRRDLITVSAVTQSSNILPVLPHCWETEMSERLGRVVVHRDSSGDRTCTSTITDIEQDYHQAGVARSL